MSKQPLKKKKNKQISTRENQIQNKINLEQKKEKRK